MTAKVLLSGGIDSTACIAYYTSRSLALEALFVDYGQPLADQESKAAAKVADYFGTRLHTLTVSPYSANEGYVSGRNALLVCLALAVFGDGPYTLGIGIHKGTDYVDCTPAFERAIQAVIDIYAGGKIMLDAPFREWTKGEILFYARSQKVPLHLTCTSNPADSGSLV